MTSVIEEQATPFTVTGVPALSTAAMITCPMIVHRARLDPFPAGFVLVLLRYLQ